MPPSTSAPAVRDQLALCEAKYAARGAGIHTGHGQCGWRRADDGLIVQDAEALFTRELALVGLGTNPQIQVSESGSNVGDGGLAVIHVLEVLLEVGNVDDLAFLEGGIGHCGSKGLGVREGAITASFAGLIGWKESGAFASEGGDVAHAIGETVEGEFHTGLGGARLRVDERKQQRLNDGEVKE
jgi:hypothetical protein